VIRSAIVRSDASPLYANRGASDYGAQMSESRCFKIFRGIVLREARKRPCIKNDVLLDPCAGSGCFLAKHIDIISPLPGSRRQHFDLFPRTEILRRQGRVHRKVKHI
jgi:hypothetical protein